MTDPTQVRDWLVQLSVRIAPAIKVEEITARINLLAVDLAETFDAEVFTRDAMLAVARKHPRYWPSYGELCEALEPIASNVRLNRYLAIEYADRPVAKAAPYELPPPPEWCFERESRHMGRVERGELNIQKPIRTPEEQIAILLGEALPAANADAAPLRAAAADIAREVRRGPVIEDAE